MPIHHYECEGQIRGNCGHRHRTLSGARKCFDRDAYGCKIQGGYSDRDIIEVSDDGSERIIRPEPFSDGYYYPEDFDKWQ